MAITNVVPAKAGTYTEFDLSRNRYGPNHHPEWIMEKPSYVYILASTPYGTLYTGVTSNIVKRVWQHKEDLASGFTKTYGVHRLVWYEIQNDILAAITREKQIKAWKRSWKIRMILEANPTWRDLYLDFTA